jgi:hypothetical protein
VAYLKYYADSAETRAVELWYLITVSWVQFQVTVRENCGGQSATKSRFSLPVFRFPLKICHSFFPSSALKIL